jgi:membrane protease YdiL (CAAX protease family)
MSLSLSLTVSRHLFTRCICFPSSYRSFSRSLSVSTSSVPPPSFILPSVNYLTKNFGIHKTIKLSPSLSFVHLCSFSPRFTRFSSFVPPLRSIHSSSNPSPHSASSLLAELPAPLPIASTISFSRFPLLSFRVALSEVVCFVVALLGGHACFFLYLQSSSDDPSFSSFSPISLEEKHVLLSGQVLTNFLIFCFALLIARVRSVPIIKLASEQARNKPKASFLIRLTYFITGCVAILTITPLLIKKFNIASSEDVLLSRFVYSFDPVIAFLCSFASPISEEILFRLFLFSRLVVQVGTIPALLWTSFVFGVLHSSNTSDKVASASVAGFLLSLCYRYTQTLIVPIAIHIVNNSFAVLISMANSPFNHLSHGAFQCVLNTLLWRASLPSLNANSNDNSFRSHEILADADRIFHSLDIQKRGYLTDREIFFIFSLTPLFTKRVEPGLWALMDQPHASVSKLEGRTIKFFAPVLTANPRLNLKAGNHISLTGAFEPINITIPTKQLQIEEGEQIWNYYVQRYNFSDLQASLQSSYNSWNIPPRAEGDTEKVFPSKIPQLLSFLRSQSDNRQNLYFLGNWLAALHQAYILSTIQPAALRLNDRRFKPWKAQINEEEEFSKLLESMTKVQTALIESAASQVRDGNSSQEVKETLILVDDHFPHADLFRQLLFRDPHVFLLRDLEAHFLLLSQDSSSYDAFMSNFMAVASGSKPHPFDFAVIDRNSKQQGSIGEGFHQEKFSALNP